MLSNQVLQTGRFSCRFLLDITKIGNEGNSHIGSQMYRTLHYHCSMEKKKISIEKY